MLSPSDDDVTESLKVIMIVLAERISDLERSKRVALKFLDRQCIKYSDIKYMNAYKRVCGEQVSEDVEIQEENEEKEEEKGIGKK